MGKNKGGRPRGSYHPTGPRGKDNPRKKRHREYVRMLRARARREGKI